MLRSHPVWDKALKSLVSNNKLNQDMNPRKRKASQEDEARDRKRPSPEIDIFIVKANWSLEALLAAPPVVTSTRKPITATMSRQHYGGTHRLVMNNLFPDALKYIGLTAPPPGKVPNIHIKACCGTHDFDRTLHRSLINDFFYVGRYSPVHILHMAKRWLWERPPS